jgi:hypothetical protein
MPSSLARRLAFAFLAPIACACSTPPTDTVAQSTAALSPSANDATAFFFFVGKGLTPIQAAGIVGNLDQESQVDPGAVQAGGPGRGIAQWSVGGRWDTDANDNVVWYAGTQGESSSSLNLQLEFVWYELQTFSSYGLAALQASTNVTDATVAFETDFEGCGTCDQSTRISYAEAALAAYGTVDYGAAYVAQSFPLASTAVTMVSGSTVPGWIELENTGAKAWDSSTRLGTSNPRDRVSAFADSSWVAPNRPAAVSGSVATGGTYKFTFNLHAPADAGTYYEYFDVVEEGVAWFSDPGQGGPPDDQLEVQILVVPAPATSPPPDAGPVDEVDGGAPTGTTNPGSDGGTLVVADDAGLVVPPAIVPGTAGGGDDAGVAGGATGSGAHANAGCAVGSVAGGDGELMSGGLWNAMVAFARTRRRAREKFSLSRERRRD